MKLSVNDVLKDSFEMVVKNFPGFFVLALFSQAGVLANIAFINDTGAAKEILIDYLLYYVIFFWGALAMLYYAAGKYFNKETTIKKALAGAMERFPLFFGVAAVVFAATMAGFAAFLIPGIYVMVIWGVADAVAAYDDRDIAGCLRESKRLVDGSFWRVLGIIGILTLLTFMLGGIFSGLSENIVFKWKPAAAYGPVLDEVARALPDIIMAPLFAAATFIMYKRLNKIKREDK